MKKNKIRKAIRESIIDKCIQIIKESDNEDIKVEKDTKENV